MLKYFPNEQQMMSFMLVLMTLFLCLVVIIGLIAIAVLAYDFYVDKINQIRRKKRRGY